MDTRSNRNLKGVDTRLVAVVERANELLLQQEGDLNFIVTEGVRTSVRQAELMRAGASRTMRSKHLIGHAVDLAATVNGEVRWDWPLYSILASYMKQAAAEQKLPLVWGGDWQSFRDGPHFEIGQEA
jgi:peptidoglycan L-alanyl-D-glutamate endopeptidase CwlK